MPDPSWMARTPVQLGTDGVAPTPAARHAAPVTQPAAGRSTWPVTIGVVGVVIAVVIGLLVVSAVRTPQVTPPSMAAAPATGAGGPVSYGPAGLFVQPAPPAGFVGQIPVAIARGTGSVTTSVLVLGGGRLSGVVQTSGGETATTFTLVPEQGPSPTEPMVTDGPSAGSGGWVAHPSPLAGRYRLRVESPATTAWQLDINEDVEPPLSLVTKIGDQGVTSVAASGIGDQCTATFHITLGTLPRTTTVPQLPGGFNAEGALVAYLVPASHPAPTDADRFVSAAPGTSGGLAVPVAADGDYYLVVRTTGTWQLSFSASG